MPEIINYILYPLVLTMMIILPITNLLFYKISKNLLLVFTIILYFIAFILFNSKQNSIAFPILLLYIIICIYIATKNLLHSIIISLFVFIIISIGDASVGVVVLDIFGISYEKAKSTPQLYLIIGIFILIISYILSKILRCILNKLNSINISLKKYKNIQSLLIFTIAIILMILSVYLFMCKYLLIDWDSTLVVLHLSLLLCFFLISLILLYSILKITTSIIQQENIDKEYTQLKEYTTIVESVSTDLRRFKHDYLNILTTLGDYIEEKDLTGLSDFYHSELLPKSNKLVTKDKHLDLLKYIKLTPLKSLISSKIISAQALGIETKLEISDDISKLPIDTIDICRIMGILLDNAIEGTLLCKEKLIHFAAIKVDTNTIFVINNTCVENLPPIYKLYEENFSTKGEGHGIGLKTVRDIINNDYNNVLINTKIEDGLFKQELIIRENDN